MGGNCRIREQCQVYHLGGNDPHERACYSNADGKSPDEEVAKVLSLQRLVQWQVSRDVRNADGR